MNMRVHIFVPRRESQPCRYMTYDLKSKILLLDIGKTKVSSHGEGWGAVET